MFRSLSTAVFGTVLGAVLILQSPQTVNAQTTSSDPSTQEELKQVELRLDDETQRIEYLYKLFQFYHPDTPATLRTEIKDAQVYVYLGGPTPAQEKLKAFLLSPPPLHLKVRKPQANAPWIELGPVQDWMALPVGATWGKSCMELKAMGIKNIQKVDSPLQELSIELEFSPEDRAPIKDLTSRYIGKEIGIFIDGQLISSPTITYAIDSVSSTLSLGSYENKAARDWVQKIQAHPEGLIFKEKTATGWVPIQTSITLQNAKARGVYTSLAWLELVFKDSDRAKIKTFTA